jgi:hypothetical protein
MTPAKANQSTTTVAASAPLTAMTRARPAQARAAARRPSQSREASATQSHHNPDDGLCETPKMGVTATASRAPGDDDEPRPRPPFLVAPGAGGPLGGPLCVGRRSPLPRFRREVTDVEERPAQAVVQLDS